MRSQVLTSSTTLLILLMMSGCSWMKQGDCTGTEADASNPACSLEISNTYRKNEKRWFCVGTEADKGWSCDTTLTAAQAKRYGDNFEPLATTTLTTPIDSINPAVTDLPLIPERHIESIESLEVSNSIALVGPIGKPKNDPNKTMVLNQTNGLISILSIPTDSLSLPTRQKTLKQTPIILGPVTRDRPNPQSSTPFVGISNQSIHVIPGNTTSSSDRPIASVNLELKQLEDQVPQIEAIASRSDVSTVTDREQSPLVGIDALSTASETLESGRKVPMIQISAQNPLRGFPKTIPASHPIDKPVNLAVARQSTVPKIAISSETLAGTENASTPLAIPQTIVPRQPVFIAAISDRYPSKGSKSENLRSTLPIASATANIIMSEDALFAIDQASAIASATEAIHFAVPPTITDNSRVASDIVSSVNQALNDDTNNVNAPQKRENIIAHLDLAPFGNEDNLESHAASAVDYITRLEAPASEERSGRTSEAIASVMTARALAPRSLTPISIPSGEQQLIDAIASPINHHLLRPKIDLSNFHIEELVGSQRPSEVTVGSATTAISSLETLPVKLSSDQNTGNLVTEIKTDIIVPGSTPFPANTSLAEVYIAHVGTSNHHDSSLSSLAVGIAAPPPNPTVVSTSKMPLSVAETRPKPNLRETDSSSVRDRAVANVARLDQLISPDTEVEYASMKSPSSSGDSTFDYFMDLPNDDFAIQLKADKTLGGILNFATSVDVTDPMVLKLQPLKKPLFVLVLDTFDDIQLASDAKRAWVAKYDNGVEPWIRTVGSLQKSMQPIGPMD